MLILNPKICEVLGGNVDHLIQKWKQSKVLFCFKHKQSKMNVILNKSKELQELQHMRGKNLTHSAPPAWVPFGTRQVIQGKI